MFLNGGLLISITHQKIVEDAAGPTSDGVRIRFIRGVFKYWSAPTSSIARRRCPSMSISTFGYEPTAAPIATLRARMMYTEGSKAAVLRPFPSRRPNEWRACEHRTTSKSFIGKLRLPKHCARYHMSLVWNILGHNGSEREHETTRFPKCCGLGYAIKPAMQSPPLGDGTSRRPLQSTL